MINSALIINSLPQLIKGLLVSLEVAMCALAIGFSCGTILGILELSSNWLLKNLIKAYVSLIRGTPMLIQIVFLYYILSITGFALSPFIAAIFAIGLNSSAYVSQIVKAGIRSVERGQIEAARTLGISRMDIIRFILLPQALRVVLPALGNEAITLVKDSSLASLIGVTELYRSGQIIISQTYDALSIYCIVGALYLCVTLTLSYIVNYLEQRYNHHVKNFSSF